MANTVRIARIRSRHLGRQHRWNRSRVLRLCHVCRITPQELCAYIDWDMTAMRRAFKTNTFPGPVCIVLDLFEAHAFKQFLGEDIEFDLPFPSDTT